MEPNYKSREKKREIVSGKEKGERGFSTLYTLLGVGIVVICVGLVFLFTSSC